ncbi:MAG: MMPL family transporter [Alphaproteobacteria bacterium]|nr:MMPL family transporter [Alphaproteobacteria bacterium]
MNPVSQFLSYLGQKITQHTHFAIFTSLAVIVTLIFGVLHLQLVGAVGNIFDPQSQYVKDFQDFTETYESLEREIVIVIENDDILSDESRNEISNLHLELEFLDDVNSVISIASLRDAPQKIDSMGQLIADDNFAKYGKELIQQKLYEHPIARHRLISADGKKSMILIGLKSVGERNASLQEINDQAAALAARELQHSQFYFTGFLAVSAEIVSAILHDQIYFVLGGATLGFIFGFLFFRHFSLVMATAVPSILSILITLGAMGWAGISVNVMTNVVPTIIMVIAFADSMHMVDAMRNRLELGESREQAVIYAMKVVGPACVFTSLTTSIAFLSLTFADTPLVAEFGRAAAMGTFLALFASLILSCLICLYLGRVFPVKIKAGAAPSNGIIHQILSDLSRSIGGFSIKHAKKTIAIGSLLLIGSGYIHFLNEPEYRYSENLPANNHATQAIKTVDQDLGGMNGFYYVVSRQDGAVIDFDAPSLLPILTQLDQLVENTPTHSSHSSVIQVMNWLGEGAQKPSINDLLENLPAKFTRRFIAPDQKSIIIIAFTADLGARVLRPFLRDMRAAAKKIVAQDPEYKLMLTGLAAMSAEESYAMIGELNSGLLIAMVIIILLMGIVFRSGFYALASILPNLLPIVAGGALLYFIADGLQFTTVIALTIAFGIAVDDSIHFLYQYRQNIKHMDAAGAIDDALKRVGPVLMATTFMLSAGLGLMFFSDLPQMNLFGVTIIFILNVALLADIAILPSIFYIMDRKKNLKE